MKVELPPRSADNPAWAKVGAIALVGFAVGVLWPRVAGWKLGPDVPGDAHPAAAAAARAEREKAKEPALMATTHAPPAAAMSGAAAAGSGGDGFEISAVEITRCRDAKGKAVEKCDEIALDPLLQPRLRDLTKCPSAIGLSGKVQLGFDLDFKHKSLKVQRAKGKLPRTTLDGLTKCAERALSGVSFDDLTHEQVRYAAEYKLGFGAKPEAAKDEPPKEAKKDEPAADTKTVEVSWRSTQVRESPKTGNVIARLSKGAKVTVLEQKDGWYKVEFGDPKRQGWVFREAIGQ